MAPAAGDRLNALETSTERLQEGLDELRQEQAARSAATCKIFVKLKESISNLGTKTQANIDTLGVKTQASIDALAARVQSNRRLRKKISPQSLYTDITTSGHTSACGITDTGNKVVVANGKGPSICGTTCIAFTGK